LARSSSAWRCSRFEVVSSADWKPTHLADFDRYVAEHGIPRELYPAPFRLASGRKRALAAESTRTPEPDLPPRVPLRERIRSGGSGGRRPEAHVYG
jgi:hypothetical protein